MSGIKGTGIPSTITLVVGLVIFAEYYASIPSIKELAGFLTNTAVAIASLAIILGAINVLSIHGGHVVKRTKREDQWFFSLCLLVPMFVTAVAGLIPPIATHPVYSWFFGYLYQKPVLAVSSILAFYIGSAAFRAFRARSVEATILLLAGCITILAGAPIGSAVLPQITPVGEWFMSVPNMAAQRGIILTSAVGAVALAVRVFIGRERLGGGA